MSAGFLAIADACREWVQGCWPVEIQTLAGAVSADRLGLILCRSKLAARKMPKLCTAAASVISNWKLGGVRGFGFHPSAALMPSRRELPFGGHVSSVVGLSVAAVDAMSTGRRHTMFRICDFGAVCATVTARIAVSSDSVDDME